MVRLGPSQAGGEIQKTFVAVKGDESYLKAVCRHDVSCLPRVRGDAHSDAWHVNSHFSTHKSLTFWGGEEGQAGKGRQRGK